MKELIRLQVGEFKIENSITINELKENRGNALKYITTVEQFFESKEKILLDSNKLEQFLNGVKLKMPLQNGIYRIYNNENKFIGLGLVNEQILKRDIVL
jgi:tRNA pseudouridine55 synthase